MKNTSFLIVVLCAALLAACTPAATPTVAPCPTSVNSSASACALPSKTAPALPAGALFQVLLADGKVVPFSAADLGKLPAVQISLEGKTQNGVRLLDVLQAASVSDFTQVTLNGETTTTLKKEQVTADLVLVSGGSARLVAPSLTPEQQVRGITTLRVK